MNIPVLIPARNEADQIGTALESLSRQTYGAEPIVITNGSTDQTPDIARNMGATVLESPEGKIPALQAGLRYLGARALEPVLILDADSRPFTKNWSGHMSQVLESLPAEAPAITWGPYAYSGEINPALGAFFTATTMRVSWADRNKERPRTIRGGNTGLFIKNEAALEEMLALPNFWPRADVATFDTLKSHGANHTVTLHPNAWVLTSGYRISETLRKIIKERRHPSLVMDGSYAAEAPAGSTPYHSDTTATVRH